MNAGFDLPVEAAIPVDGRQSLRALSIRRGTLRLLASLDIFALPEVTLASGRRADLLGITQKGEVLIVEIKSSRADFLVDRKWPEYRSFCDRFYFATAPDMDEDMFPTDAGLIVADGYGAAMVRDASWHPLAAATRKALLIRVARLGALRMTALSDPDIVFPETI